ncbi:hypothetical protein NDU88_005639 [Pleurodeles waltl]|uniref:Uncharacterized protein n=1 Tax=Pleurodeles waltl TaxID=8319 RepID=A0AAV7W8E6_PLEWA|nr:hypothetical protein NDU88_005639 [Pleurodeles waltl]
MLDGQRKDTSLTSPGWQPAPYHLEQAQARRKRVNDRARKKKRAASRAIRIGDQVIIKGWKPVWKFRTPCEPGLFTITGVSGTNETAEKRRDQVTRNISWFRKSTFEVHSDMPDGADYFHDWSRTGVQGPGSENELPLAAGQILLIQPVTSAPRARDGESRSKSGRYNLRPNPLPSQRPKYFACGLTL